MTESPRRFLTEQELLELVGFLASSARCLVREPKDYGPMRLMSAATWLSRTALPRADDDLKTLLAMIADETPVWQSERRRDPEGYLAFLDECCRQIALELKRRKISRVDNDEKCC